MLLRQQLADGRTDLLARTAAFGQAIKKTGFSCLVDKMRIVQRRRVQQNWRVGAESYFSCRIQAAAVRQAEVGDHQAETNRFDQTNCVAQALR